MTGEFSVYVHIPFCSKKCPYCHFFVLKDKDAAQALFTDALIDEWKQKLPLMQGKKLVSLYFGGGTPTRLKIERLERILAGIEIDASCEITLEANPEDVTEPLMKRYRELGINRVSLGIQSLQESQLSVLGRSHGVQRGLEAIEQIKSAGIDNISIDLMYEIPRQNLTGWHQTLVQLKSLPITHLSLYNLTFEPHTPFFKQQARLEKTLPSDKEALAMLEEGVLAIEALGLKRYEISAFARPGYEAIHNTGYWQGRPFLGLGPSAFSYWEGCRYRNIANLTAYARQVREGQDPSDFRECLPSHARQGELLAIGLRMMQGVDLQAFQARWGQLIPVQIDTLNRLYHEGWLIKHLPDTYSLSPKGMLFYDFVASEIIA